MSLTELRDAVRDSPARAFSLFTVRAAISSARLSERPACFSLFFTCSYWRARFVPFFTRGVASHPPQSSGGCSGFRFPVAGPFNTSPRASKREPWQGQSQVRSASFQCDDAAEVRAARRDRVQDTVVVAVNRLLAQAVADHPALPGSQLGGAAAALQPGRRRRCRPVSAPSLA